MKKRKDRRREKGSHPPSIIRRDRSRDKGGPMCKMEYTYQWETRKLVVSL
jgi:hypothetical protein